MLGPYDKDNLRFRKAYIRMRLESLKNERVLLIKERDGIDASLNEKKMALKTPETESL